MTLSSEDWELTSRRDARSETSDMEAHQVTSGAQPVAQEAFGAIQAILDSLESHTDPIEEPFSMLRGHHSRPARSSGADSTTSTAAAADADAAETEAPNNPASAATSIINEILESGGHMPQPMQQQQQPQQQQAPEDMWRVKYMDRRIAEGNLDMHHDAPNEYINIMTFGESGLGKTTFIKNLVLNFPLNLKPGMGAAFELGGRTSPAQFKSHPDSMRLETHPIMSKSTNANGARKGLVISIQDMPGWGDEIDLVSNLKTVVEFLLEQRKKDLVAEKAGSTESSPYPGSVMKHGITVCLYFLPPQRAKELDWFMLEGISSLVAVVPVIAKADTHTASELEAYKREVVEVIQRATSQAAAAGPQGSSSLVTPFKPYSFEPSALNAVLAQGPPFAVMGSQTVLGPEDASQGPVGDPYRRYLWGTALPLDRDHSDVMILKSLLTGHGNSALSGLWRDSWARAHAFYKRYEQLKEEQIDAKVASGELSGSLGEIRSKSKELVVDMNPMVDEVCGSVSIFGGGQQQLQDRLMCAGQHRLQHRLWQAQGELEQIRKSSISPLKFRLVVAVAVVLAFVVGAVVAFGVGHVYSGWGVGGDGQGACAAHRDPGSDGFWWSRQQHVCSSGGGEDQPMPPPSASVFGLRLRPKYRVL